MGNLNPLLPKRRLLRMAIALVIGSGLVAGGIWLLTKTLGSRQARYQGQPLYYWVEQVNSHDTAARNRAGVVLRQAIIPQLTDVMFHDTNDSKLRLILVDKLNGLPGVFIYFLPADGRRAAAANSLGELGPAASDAIPVLIQALKGRDEAVRGEAARALGKIRGQPDVVIPLLISYLDDKEVNDEAAEALGGFGSLARTAVPKLVPLLKVPDKDLHHAVVEALKKIDPAVAAGAAQGTPLPRAPTQPGK